MALLEHPATRPLRTRGGEHALFREYLRERDPDLRNALVERYMPLARHLARRYPAGGEREDVLQVAMLALVKAVDRFDPDRGSAFTSFATPTILGEIKRYFRDHGWVVRVPRELQDRALRVDRESERLTAKLGRSPTAAELSDAMGIGVEDVLEALTTESAHRPMPLERPSRDGEDQPAIPVASVDDPGFERVEDAASVESLLLQLGEQERLVLLLRFREDLLQREIAKLVGISQMQVSRVLAKALAELSRLADAE
jgi:RNA polymerase sigma-B factor